MEIILKATNLHKTYRMGKVRLEVLRGINLEIPRGQFAAVIGASGSGKSTLLHILGALDKPDSGSVHYENQRLDRMRWSQLNHFRNRTVGFVFQFYHLLDELTVLENVMTPAMVSAGIFRWIKTKASIRKRAYELLEQFGLKDRLDHKPYELSGGERQRVAIARALINQPPLLLADEPTGNLDSRTGHGILDTLAELNRQGQTIIMVTHDERIAARASRIIRLVDGKVKEVAVNQ
ncbi:MAG TPA: ABC transporter ATP-binding protein [Anaerohalosphaeraceae bacterium]|nr:ABC transporter ATP-binding protein [Phycisphaerae bacterium]HOK96136.1 ABC transporter ATP-binding protein [Anaerohalosphaeraceae bacterium]HOL30368.1 ABC transporter ATP-binding protein [Anaerohalosphaeraceae bacterium]HOM75626.1 ABC transporter ATP-binding protein [Anaerohalosphaeraceae bacterium]HPC63066.1 ABC transporter ATP-binding protein [Anaerohalosphaeraceae bacterium]